MCVCVCVCVCVLGGGGGEESLSKPKAQVPVGPHGMNWAKHIYICKKAQWAI